MQSRLRQPHRRVERPVTPQWQIRRWLDGCKWVSVYFSCREHRRSTVPYLLDQRGAAATSMTSTETLESTLNSYASEGWRVVSVAAAANLMESAKAELVVVLERATSATGTGSMA